MDCYINELAPEIKGEGTKEISISIEHSFNVKPAYFEIYSNHNKWILYRNSAPLLSDVIQAVKMYSKRSLSINEIANNKEILQCIHKKCDIHKYELNKEETLIVKKFLEKKLPEVKKLPFGLDGHNYAVAINSDNRKYHCWCVIPKEWTVLGELIEMVVKKTELPDYYLASISE